MPLGDCLTLQRGFDLSTAERKPGSVPVVSSSGITGYHSTAPVKGPGVVTGRYGTIGQVFYVEQDFWPLNTTLWVKDFKGNNPKFASFLLRTINFRSCSDKSSVPGVNRNDLHRILVDLPPLGQQQAIADVLSAFDDKIELNRCMNQTLESMARAIFRSWFVDFDPPEGNATRIGDMVRRGYLEVGDGYRAKNSELSSSGLPFARAGNLKAGFDFSGADCFPTERITAVGAKVSRPGDVVFTSKGTVGRLAYVHVSTPQFVYSPQLCYWRVIDPGVIDPRWLYRWMQFGDFRDQCDEVKGQTDMADYVSLRDQQTMCLGLPDIGTQRGLGDVLGSLGKQVELNRRMNDTLAALRDALLPKLMSGELRVRDAEKLADIHV